MDANSQAVLQAALALPESDRARIAEELLATIPAETNDLDDGELADELDRRLEEARRDPTATIPWSEIRDQA